jgi:hypothetical protein
MFRTADVRGERILLVIVVAIPLGLNLAVTFLRVEPPWPLTPWEPALLTEGWRFANGVSLYDASAQGHATHLYGPMFTVLMAGLQSLFGFNFPAIRLVFVLLGVLTSLGLAFVMSPVVRSWKFVLTATLFLSCSLQTGLSFPLSWADMPALSCGVGAMVILLHPAGRIGWVRGVLGCALALLAFLFKQTAAMAGVVLLILWFFSPALRRRCGFWLCLPLAATAGCVLIIAVFFPAVFQQVVIVPASIEIVGERGWDGFAYVLRGHPIFWACVGLVAARAADLAAIESPNAWIVAGVVTLLLSVWTYAKAGGYYNSLLPAFLILSVFSVVVLNSMSSSQISEWTGVAKAAMALAFVVTTTAGTLEAIRLTGMTHGDANYLRAIELARGLQGSVVCPEDPSIPLLGKGVPGRSLFLELDFASRAGRWPSETPPRIAADLQAADWLIRVRGTYGAMNDSRLPSGSGWTEVRMPGLENSVYSLWRKAKPGPATATPS